MKSAILIVMILSTLLGFSLGRVDLINKRQSSSSISTGPLDYHNVCDRRYHATTVVGDRLYINGGQNIVNRTKSIDDYADFDNIQYIDLSKSWNISNPALTTNTKPSSVVTVQEACAWSDGIDFYQYGGWRSSTDQESFRVWDLNVTTSEWTSVSPGTVNRLASGACTDAPMIKKSYAYGGFQEARTTSDAWYVATGSGYGSPDLIEFDWTTKIARNVTYTDKSNGIAGTLDNGVAYVPVGSEGILVDLSGRRSNRADGFSQLSGFSEIRLFDIASSTWYYQTTKAALSSDGVPNARVQACTVVQPASDNSSFNIYMFAGSSDDTADGSFNDIWVLSLPSFKWIKIRNVAETSGNIPGARTAHTCQLIGKRQMVVIGGARSSAAHKQCLQKSVFVYDMTKLIWRDGYDPSETAYELPKNITNVIGGDEFGNAVASKNKPDSWTNEAVQDIFFGSDSTSTSNSTEPTSTPDPSSGNSTPTGAIVGGVVGGVAALAALAVGLLFFRRRRRHKEELKRDQPVDAQEIGPGTVLHELDPAGATPAYELGGDYYSGQEIGDGTYSGINELDAAPQSPQETSETDRFMDSSKLSPTSKKPVPT